MCTSELVIVTPPESQAERQSTPHRRSRTARTAPGIRCDAATELTATCHRPHRVSRTAWLSSARGLGTKAEFRVIRLRSCDSCWLETLPSGRVLVDLDAGW